MFFPRIILLVELKHKVIKSLRCKVALTFSVITVFLYTYIILIASSVLDPVTSFQKYSDLLNSDAS